MMIANRVRISRAKILTALTLGALLVATAASWGAQYVAGQGAQSALAQAQAFADPAFQKTWERTDLPVQQGKAPDRSWMWGPQPNTAGLREPYAEAPGGQIQVQYFDKSRMEIFDPNGDRNSKWFVTNGLLVVELMTGQIKTGNTAYIQSRPAQIPVAGDAASSVDAPTYASLAKVASLNGGNRAANRTGQAVDQGLDRQANVLQVNNHKSLAHYVYYEPTLGHNIPDVFWSFMNQSGPVYENGQIVNGLVVDWVFAMGYPLTEPYWIQIVVNNKPVFVLMQAFQRRILTYNPANDPAFQVEMGNVGLSYYDWRYNQQGGPLPTATPVPPTAPPLQASITLKPPSGPSDADITVEGKQFPAYAGVTLSVRSPSNDFLRDVSTVAADANGNFSTFIELPPEVSAQASVNVIATASGGSVQVSQTYTIEHNSEIVIDPPETTSNGVVQVTGFNFPANTQITLRGQNTRSNALTGSTSVTSASDGTFSLNYTLQGQAQPGTAWNVVATLPDGKQVVSDQALKIVNPPTAQVQPSSGPAGTAVTFTGSQWQPNRTLQFSYRPGDGSASIISTVPIVTDSAGNFLVRGTIPPQFAGQTQVTLEVVDTVNQTSARANFAITGGSVPPTAAPIPPTATPIPPAPGQPTVAPIPPTAGVVTPGPPAANLPMDVRVTYNPGQVPSVRLQGTGWPAGSSLGAVVSSQDGSVNASAGRGTVGGDGSFEINFDETAEWAARNDLLVTVTGNKQDSSIRLLPVTRAAATDTGFTVSGANWPNNTRLQLVVNLQSGGSQTVTAPQTDAAGAFTVEVPATRTDPIRSINLTAQGQPYEAIYFP